MLDERQENVYSAVPDPEFSTGGDLVLKEAMPVLLVLLQLCQDILITEGREVVGTSIKNTSAVSLDEVNKVSLPSRDFTSRIEHEGHWSLFGSSS